MSWRGIRGSKDEVAKETVTLELRERARARGMASVNVAVEVTEEVSRDCVDRGAVDVDVETGKVSGEARGDTWEDMGSSKTGERKNMAGA